MLPARATPAELIDQALVFGKRHFWTLFRLGALPIVATTVLSQWSRRFGAFTNLRGAACLFAAYGCMALAEAAMMSGAWQLLHGRLAPARTVWVEVGRRADSVVLSFVVKSLMLTLGLVLFVIPGLYLIALYFAVPGVNVIESLNVRASFARSRALGRGALLHVFRSHGLFWLSTVLIGYALAQLLRPLGAPVTLARLVPLAWVLLAAPFRAIVATLVYADLRVRTEGYDLQLALASLPAPARS